MAVIKRHWKVSLLLFVLMVAGGGWLLMINLMAPSADAQVSAVSSQDGSAPAIDAVSYCEVRLLRQHLRLGDQELAAVGCDEAQARDILSGLVSWHAANRDELRRVAADVRNAKRELRIAQKKINMGPRDEALIASCPRLAKTLADVLMVERDLWQQAGQAVASKLSVEQASVWQNARKNAGVSGTYRFASNLSAEQVATLCRQDRSQTCPTSASFRLLQEDVAVHMQQVLAIKDVALTATQESEANAAKVRIASNIAAVCKASSEVLPVPEQLKAPELSPEQVEELLKRQPATR